jgi:hypothetical protein
MALKQTHNMHGVAVDDLEGREAAAPFLGGIVIEQIKIEESCFKKVEWLI